MLTYVHGVHPPGNRDRRWLGDFTRSPAPAHHLRNTAWRAAFLVFLAYQNITIRKADLYRPASAPASLVKGIVTNLLNPYLYIFWFSVALPIFAKGNLTGSALFAAALLLSVVGSLMAVAGIVAVLRTRFMDSLHWIIRGLSVLLFLIAIIFIREGIALLS
ncbi:MAG: LysE family transporter [Candidatus Peregrinibacteria bacterium]|nr:LysE family transporter [Candidatus Peregrinibacteria bacterium]